MEKVYNLFRLSFSVATKQLQDDRRADKTTAVWTPSLQIGLHVAKHLRRSMRILFVVFVKVD